MADLSTIKVTIDLDAKTANVGFSSSVPGTGKAHIAVFNVPWDTPDDQTESQIRALVIENARKLLREA